MEIRGKFRRITGILVAVGMAILIVNPVQAGVSGKNIGMSDREARAMCYSLGKYIAVGGDASELDKYKELFEGNTWYDVESNRNITGLRFVQSQNNYTAEAAYSSTGDTVIVMDIKACSDDYSTNKLILIEMHVNTNGKIYGMNIWQY